MKTLPLGFDSKGFTHRQIIRDGSVAVYERRRKGATQVPHYELVRVGSHNGYEVAGRKVEPAETYPSSEQWGSRGFTFNEESKAMARFEALKGAK